MRFFRLFVLFLGLAALVFLGSFSDMTDLQASSAASAEALSSEGPLSVSLTASESTEENGPAYKITSEGGEEALYTASSFAALRNSIQGMKDGETVTLLADFTADESSKTNNGITISKGISIAIDLNGHTVTFEKDAPLAYFKINPGAALSLCSSAPGGALCLSSSAATPFFYNGGTLYVGTDEGGTVYGPEKLLLSGTSIVRIGSGSETKLRGACICASGSGELFSTPNASSVDLQIEDCVFSLSSFTGSVFSAKKKGFAVTAKDSRFYFYGEEACLTYADTGAAGTLALSGDCVLSYQGLAVDTAFPLSLSDGVLLSHSPERDELPVESECPSQDTESGATGEESEDAEEETVWLLPEGSAYARISPRCPTDPITGAAVAFPLRFLISEKKDTHTVTFVSEGEETVSECWRTGEIPSHTFGISFGSYYYEVTGDGPISQDTVCRERTLRSSVSKVSGCLSLTESITFRLYIQNDGYIASAEAGGVRAELSSTEPESNGCFLFLLPMDPKNLTEVFPLTLTLSNGETYTVPLSLQGYIRAVLRAYPRDTATVRLVKALAAYVKEVSCYFFEHGQLTCEPSASGLAAIEEILGASYELPKHEIPSLGTLPPVGGKAILSAALNLLSDPGYAFRLNEAFTGTVTVSHLGRAVDYRVENGLWNGYAFLLVESIGLSAFRSEITVVCRGESDDALDFTFTYDLDAYMRGFTDGIPPYAYALYDYVLAAEEYVKANG